MLFFDLRLRVGNVSRLKLCTDIAQAFPQRSFRSSSPKPGIYIYICICHHAFQIVIAKGRTIFQCFGNMSFNVVPNAITLLRPGFLHLMYLSDFVCELRLGMFDLKEFNLLRVLRQLCSCFVRIGAIREASGATSSCRAHARENFGLEDFLTRVVGMIS